MKAALDRVGVEAEKVSGHSLRAGYCTQAAMIKMPPFMIRVRTGNKNAVTLAQYPASHTPQDSKFVVVFRDFKLIRYPTLISDYDIHSGQRQLALRGLPHTPPRQALMQFAQ